MRSKPVKVIYVVVLVILLVSGFWLLETEEFDTVRSLKGDGDYLLHTEELIPRASPDILIAEDGKLFLFYIESELVNVYAVSGEFLYGIQFPDGNKGNSDMFYKDDCLYVDARLSGIYIFQDTQLIRFEEQHYKNEGHDELEEVFTGEENHTDGEYTYFYVESDNKIMRRGSAGIENVIQFPERKIDAQLFLVLLTMMTLAGWFIWDEKARPFPWRL